MKKWILTGAGAVVIIIIVILVIGIINLGPMIKGAVNTYGPELTKTDVKVGDVIEIIRPSATAGVAKFYRVVVK